MQLTVQPAQEQNVTDPKGPGGKDLPQEENRKTAKARGGAGIPQEKISTVKCTVKDTHKRHPGGSVVKHQTLDFSSDHDLGVMRLSLALMWNLLKLLSLPFPLPLPILSL